MFNGLVINPSYISKYNALNVTLIHRNQWLGIDGAPNSSTLSLSAPIKDKNFNVGLNLVSEKYGVTKNNKISAVFSYKIIIKKNNYLSFGIHAGINTIVNNWSEINTTSTNDVVFNNSNESTTIPITGIGVFYKTDKYFIGLSIPSLLMSKKFETTYNPLFFYSGYIYKINDEIVLKPSILIKALKNSPLTTDFNLNAYYKKFGAGISVRTNDAIVFIINFEIYLN
jgi:type IX secretion system PorP/SprF family membrane protein